LEAAAAAANRESCYWWRRGRAAGRGPALSLRRRRRINDGGGGLVVEAWWWRLGVAWLSHCGNGGSMSSMALGPGCIAATMEGGDGRYASESLSR